MSETNAVAASGTLQTVTGTTRIPLSQFFRTYNVSTPVATFDARIHTDDGSYIIGPDGTHYGFGDLTPAISLSQLDQTYFVPSGAPNEAAIIAFNANTADGSFSEPAVSIAVSSDIEQGFDYPLTLDSTQVAAVSATGYKFVVRYYCSDNSEQSLTASERQDLERGGLQICAVWENKDVLLDNINAQGLSAGVEATFGGTNGITDAIDAITMAEAAGQESGSAIYFAIDLDTTSASISSYFQNIAATFENPIVNPNHYTFGAYGSGYVCQLAKDAGAKYAWLNAASYSWTNTGTFDAWNLSQVAVDEHTSVPYTNLDPSGEQFFTNPTPPAGEKFPQIVVGDAVFGVDIDVAQQGSDFGAFGANGVSPCFVAGTQIVTPIGEVAVEALQTGALVLTLGDVVRRIVWIGIGQVLATRGRRSPATPVIVRKDSLGENIPCRDLHVTKGHSLYLDGVLIPVEFLVNHHSIIWDDRAQEVTIYHVELDTHDVLIANGAPAESYRDDGNRWLFQNANSGWHLPPQAPYAPVLTGGPIVDAVWRRLLERAGPHKRLPLTDDADLHLLVDGKRIDAIERRGETHVFRLAAKPRSVRIRSRASVPQELCLARDPRALGVAVRRIVLAQARRQRAIDANAESLADGYHAYETANGFRWTDGNAVVPSVLFAGMSGPAILMLELGAATRYLDDSAVERAA